MTDPAPLDWDRAVQAAVFHSRLLGDAPYTCGPLPEHKMRQLAEAAAKMVDPATILEADTDPATRALSLHVALAAMWAAGFKTGAQAAGPADGA